MIINKKLESLNGTVEYEVIFNPQHHFFNDSDDEEIMEYKKFKNLNDLIKCLSNETLEKIKADYDDVKEVVINSVIFDSKSEDREGSTHLSVSSGIHGWISTTIDNKDVENRLMLNIREVKRIIDNSLDEYPVKY
jgi:sensor histidine kinase regulating citrate/malate metabolism